MGDKSDTYRALVGGDLLEGDHMEDLGKDGRILKWMLKTCDDEAWTGLIWLKIGASGGCLRTW